MDKDQEIEVVMKKKMSYGKYLDMIQQSKNKGWEIQAYEIGFFSDGIKNKV